MSAYTNACPPDDCGPCGTLPPGFVRLRYFYGKRLGVVDFIDEQRYHAGKLRFHNQRLHGAGVLCGLGADLLEGSDTVLRIHKGAAIDGCGREIVVGYDQCVDVDAWYARFRQAQLDDDPAWEPELDADGRLRLCVVLRFRECPAGIEPAPRDPCACDATGNDYGRVREEFELDLVLHADATAHATPALPAARADLDRALGAALGGGDLAERLRGVLQAACAEADPAARLVVACFAATLDAELAHVVGIEAIEPAATMLYSTALLEELAARTMAATLEAGAWAGGAPEVDAIRLEAGGGAPDRIRIALTDKIVFGTAAGESRYQLRRLTAQWDDVGPAMLVSYDETAVPTVTVEFAAGTFAAGVSYRLTILVDPVEPIVDAQMRPLRPLRPSFQFGVVDQAGTLVLAPAPYAAEAP
jgi:hypothetical protein